MERSPASGRRSRGAVGGSRSAPANWYLAGAVRLPSTHAPPHAPALVLAARAVGEGGLGKRAPGSERARVLSSQMGGLGPGGTRRAEGRSEQNLHTNASATRAGRMSGALRHLLLRILTIAGLHLGQRFVRGAGRRSQVGQRWGRGWMGKTNCRRCAGQCNDD